MFDFDSWLVYFYFYCIVGWIFESGNVSIRTRKWVNRGFMKGPWLPIYGFGAVIILLCTSSFSDSVVAVFFAGMVGATILEYVTGVVMLKMFKVRYWDYSYRKIQFQGHICLVSSLVWGGASILMTYIIHPPVVRLIESWNATVVDILTFVITILIAYDFANAFRDAMDLRRIIIKMNYAKERLEHAGSTAVNRVHDVADKTKDMASEAAHKTKDMAAEAAHKTKEMASEAAHKTKYKASEMAEKTRDEIITLEANVEELKAILESRAQKLLRHNPSAVLSGFERETKSIKAKIFKR